MRHVVFVVALAVGTFAVTANILGQSPAPVLTDEEYVKVMKQVGPTFQSLQKNNAAMNHAEAEKEAAKLEGWFKQVEGYWTAKKVTDGVQFAKTAQTAAQNIAKASASMDMAALGDSTKALQGACQGCHQAHREKTAEGFKIK